MRSASSERGERRAGSWVGHARIGHIVGADAEGGEEGHDAADHDDPLILPSEAVVGQTRCGAGWGGAGEAYGAEVVADGRRERHSAVVLSARRGAGRVASERPTAISCR